MAPQSSVLLPQPLPPQSMPTVSAGLPMPDHLRRCISMYSTTGLHSLLLAQRLSMLSWREKPV